MRHRGNLVEPRRHHSEDDMLSLFRHIGGGCVATGVSRIANWCEIDRESVKKWSDFFGRIPARWYEIIQQCSIEHTGVRFDIDFMETDAKRRKCLKCQDEFMSHSVGNRICNTCKGTKEWRQKINGLDDGYKTMEK